MTDKKRKPLKVVVKENYIVEDYRSPPKDDIAGYRRKKVGDHLLNITILRGKGPRGGRTAVTSVWHPKGEQDKGKDKDKSKGKSKSKRR